MLLTAIDTCLLSRLVCW